MPDGRADQVGVILKPDIRFFGCRVIDVDAGQVFITFNRKSGSCTDIRQCISIRIAIAAAVFNIINTF